ncbi:MAG: hypothetical protein IJK52_00930 [Oscillospiraceae bacterium]|nr:hypothetical protein [Oscillospiraceae bacterium]
MKNRNVCAGETLLEMSLSLCIISIAMLILSGAVYTAARVSRQTEKALNPLNFEDLDVSTVFYVQLDNPKDHSSAQIPITVTEQRNGDFYYE